MSKDTTVAARYARALFIVTEKRGETVKALADLQGALAVVGPGTRVGASLASPQLRMQDKRKALQTAFGFAVAAWLLWAHLGRGSEASSLLLLYWALRVPILGDDAVTVTGFGRKHHNLEDVFLHLVEGQGT